MQESCNNIVSQKYFDQDTVTTHSEVPPKNFLNGITNARNLLENLERSIHKSKGYERRMLQCKSTHPHSHRDKRTRTQDVRQANTETNSFKTATDAKSGWSHDNFTNPCSTMSMVCLQYQYEELTKRYDLLLRSYDACCSTLAQREAQIAQATLRADNAHAQVLHAHNAVLNVGARFMAVKRKKHLQISTRRDILNRPEIDRISSNLDVWQHERLRLRMYFEAKVQKLREAIHEVLHVAEQARRDLDEEVARKLADTKDALHTALLNEIRKSNQLNLENMKLKAQFDKLAPLSEQES